MILDILGILSTNANIYQLGKVESRMRVLDTTHHLSKCLVTIKITKEWWPGDYNNIMLFKSYKLFFWIEAILLPTSLAILSLAEFESRTSGRSTRMAPFFKTKQRGIRIRTCFTMGQYSPPLKHSVFSIKRFTAGVNSPGCNNRYKRNQLLHLQ